MHRIDGLYHNNNQFTEGDAANGVKATWTTDDWLNAIQEEIAAVVEASGLALDKQNNGQLLAALQRLAGGAVTRAVNASGNVLVTDSVLLVDATAGPVVLTLLSAAAANARALTVIKVDNSGNAVTLQAQAGQTVPTGEGRQQGVDLTIQDEFIRVLPNGVSHYHRI